MTPSIQRKPLGSKNQGVKYCPAGTQQYEMAVPSTMIDDFYRRSRRTPYIGGLSSSAPTLARPYGFLSAGELYPGAQHQRANPTTAYSEVSKAKVRGLYVIQLVRFLGGHYLYYHIYNYLSTAPCLHSISVITEWCEWARKGNHLSAPRTSTSMPTAYAVLALHTKLSADPPCRHEADNGDPSR